MSAHEDSQLRIEPIDYHHEAAFLRSNHKVPDFDAWFGFTPSTDFNEFVLRMQCYAAGINLPAGHVPSTFMLALVGDKVVGRVSIRHVLNEQLFTLGGHHRLLRRPRGARQGLCHPDARGSRSTTPAATCA
jgi:predicted acetyltransferase